MANELTPELEAMLRKANKVVDDIVANLNGACIATAQAWIAYLTEYVYASAAAVAALKEGDKEAAARHRLDATCHRARADRKHKELRRAIESLDNESSP